MPPGDQPPELLGHLGRHVARDSQSSCVGQERLGVGRAAWGRSGGPDAGADQLPLRVQGEAERRDGDHHRVAGADLAELLRPGGRPDPDRR